MSTLQAAIVVGILFGGGIFLVLLRFLPAHPDLADAMTRLRGPDAERRIDTGPADASKITAIGTWLFPHIAGRPWLRIPTSDLSLLRRSVPRFLGEKAFAATVGVVIFPALTVLAAILGHTPPLALPLFASLLLGAAMSFMPDLEVRRDAIKAREEFGRALGAYIDLVAFCRKASLGSTQSLERAAGVGDSWVFVRLSEELDRAALSGHAPWDALSQLAHELDLPALDDLADIMRLTGNEGVSVYDTLRARSASLRNAILSKEQAAAGSATERLGAPLGVLGLVVLLMITVPAVIRMAGV